MHPSNKEAAAGEARFRLYRLGIPEFESEGREKVAEGVKQRERERERAERSFRAGE